MLSVISTATGDLQLKPTDRLEMAVQAKNADGKGVNNARVFFLIGDTSVATFVDHSDSALLQLSTSEQEAAGVSSSGIAKVTIVAAESSGGRSFSVVMGLASPPVTSPEAAVATVRVRVSEAEPPAGDGGQKDETQ